MLLIEVEFTAEGIEQGMIAVKHILLSAAFLLPAGSALAVNQNCTEPGALDKTLPAEGIESLEIETGTGLVRIRGAENATEISITARACATEAAVLDDIGFDTERREATIMLSDRLPEGANHPEAAFARIDLQLEVPSRLHVDIVTRREPVSVSNVASLTLDSWRGETEVTDIKGDATIVKQRGDLAIRNVKGSLSVSRQVGEMVIENVGGDVVIERADRGNSRIESVGGSVRVVSNGRGDIAVKQVRGDFIVESNQAGRIHHDAVGGTVDIAEPGGLPEGQEPLERASATRGQDHRAQ